MWWSSSSAASSDCSFRVAALIKRLEDVQGLVGEAGEDEAPPPHY